MGPVTVCKNRGNALEILPTWVDRGPPTEKNGFLHMFIVLNKWVVFFLCSVNIPDSSAQFRKGLQDCLNSLCVYILLTFVLISSRLNTCGTACTSYRRQEILRAAILTCKQPYFSQFHILLATQTLSGILHETRYLQFRYELKVTTYLAALAVQVSSYPGRVATSSTTETERLHGLLETSVHVSV